MDNDLIIKILLSICGVLLMVGVKLLIQIADRVRVYGETLAEQKIKISYMQGDLDKHSQSIKELQKS